MRFLNHWLEIVNNIEVDGHLHEVCASVLAHYNAPTKELILYRDTFARRANNYGPDEYTYPEWLPEPQTLRLACAPDSAERLAVQLFSEWTKDVLARTPAHSAAH